MAEKKPWGITLNVALLIIGGILMLLATLGLAMAASLSFITDILPIPVASFLAIATLFMLGMAVVVFVIAYFLWQGDKYAWWILSVLLVIGIVGNVWALLTTVALPIIALVIEAVLVLGLLHKDTISFVNPGIDWKGWELED